MSQHIIYQKIAEVIQQNQSFVIIAHIRPDGDAIGSTLALASTLRTMGKDVLCLNQDPVPENLLFLPQADTIFCPQLGTPLPFLPQVGISLDCGAWKRLGDQCMATLSSIPYWINIDHHETNSNFADINCVLPQECSTGAILYHLFTHMGISITPDMRDALYTSLSTDTGSFQYDRTTPEVLGMAADLIRLGVNVHEINRKLYDEVPLRKLLLQRELLNHLHTGAQGQIAYFTLTRASKISIGTREEDTEGLIDIPRSIRGVIVALFFNELLDDERIQISLRSKDKRVSVSAIAEQFGGGGHHLAAGIRMRCTIEEAQAKILPIVCQALTNVQ